MGLAADHGAGLFRGSNRAVGGIVVIDINARPGQRRAEIGNHFADGAFLIVTGHQNRHIKPALSYAFRSTVVA